ncbi:uncharacterized protein LAESUDRAFT_238295 [Laetiporus sulphureus 93-53]|uniref:Uncharacterized protein n=1 Tax=Laetiporus sulphureus 93-53 TaxID=1314785 RepID=A0A165DNV4_9APHY|nr:uncharacterized protein LAESUDRAFT_238295 [Laetiporus sulphureus 93-53]KZT05296.1 hypothetical protein LAESUDRAFT_238295 [Laetiporus sulphureus 93-53]
MLAVLLTHRRSISPAMNHSELGLLFRVFMHMHMVHEVSVASRIASHSRISLRLTTLTMKHRHSADLVKQVENIRIRSCHRLRLNGSPRFPHRLIVTAESIFQTASTVSSISFVLPQIRAECIKREIIPADGSRFIHDAHRFFLECGSLCGSRGPCPCSMKASPHRASSLVLFNP